jgi:50S ribosomal subunit-associated GTPase HflX
MPGQTNAASAHDFQNLMMGKFPFLLIPGFFVPLAVVLHVLAILAISSRLRTATSGAVSTLDEALDASLLVHVVDAADPAFRSHIQVTKKVLEDIGAGKLPSLLILNKIDVVDSSRKALLEKEFPEGIAMPALNPQDIEALHSRLVTFFLDTMTEVELVVPYGKEGSLGDEDGKHVQGSGSVNTERTSCRRAADFEARRLVKSAYASKHVAFVIPI